MDIHSHINLLSTLVPELEPDPEPDNSISILHSSATYTTVTTTITATDHIFRWLYDAYVTTNHHLRLFVISFIPILSGEYLRRVAAVPPPQIAGIEAVLLAIYSARAGSREVVTVPDLSQPSVYHDPRVRVLENYRRVSSRLVSNNVEAFSAIKASERSLVIGVVLECYYEWISEMPDYSKVDFCKFVCDWMGRECDCMYTLDEKAENCDKKSVGGGRVEIVVELLEACLRILGHCLLGPLNGEDVKDAASVAVRCLYARMCHDVVPQGILGARGLIELDKRGRQGVEITGG